MVKSAPKSQPWQRSPHFLKQWRLYSGLSGSALGKIIGKDKGTISRYETLEIRYNQDVLEACAKALGCTVIDLLSRPPPTAPSAYEASFDAARQEHRELVARARRAAARRAAGRRAAVRRAAALKKK